MSGAGGADVDVAGVRGFLVALQEAVCAALAAFEESERFRCDEWQRGQGGGGDSRVLEGGAVFERAGVNFSHVRGARLPPAASAARPALAGRAFQAMGVSVVVHPRNPFVPISHMNVRFLVTEHVGEAPVWWFGGGWDLTPIYGFEEDCRHWHEVAAGVCAPYGPEVYPRFKRWCDEYFYLPHRGETRGVGGLFFDDLNAWGFQDSFGFARAVGDAYTRAYLPLVERRKDSAYGPREREFQLCRRGRYVEFNLVYDRGTLFGLQSGGRVESILMSLPPLAAWRYAQEPEPGSPEAALGERFLGAKRWL